MTQTDRTNTSILGQLSIEYAGLESSFVPVLLDQTLNCTESNSLSTLETNTPCFSNSIVTGKCYDYMIL